MSSFDILLLTLDKLGDVFDSVGSKDGQSMAAEEGRIDLGHSVDEGDGSLEGADVVFKVEGQQVPLPPYPLENAGVFQLDTLGPARAAGGVHDCKHLLIGRDFFQVCVVVIVQIFELNDWDFEMVLWNSFLCAPNIWSSPHSVVCTTIPKLKPAPIQAFTLRDVSVMRC